MIKDCLKHIQTNCSTKGVLISSYMGVNIHLIFIVYDKKIAFSLPKVIEPLSYFYVRSPVQDLCYAQVGRLI